MKALQIPRDVRDALKARSGGVCERCGTERATQAHHRRPRGMGGTRLTLLHSLANLLHLGNKCHAEVESNRTEAVANGWLVKQGNDPRLMPVVYRDDRPVMLGEDGTVREATTDELRRAGLFGPFEYLQDGGAA